MLKKVDPIALARDQLAADRTIDRTAKGLFAVKRARMSASAFAFLRGSAAIFYRLLRGSPELARGPAGNAWLTGDLHVQNFGAYRTDNASSGETRVVFGPNDFDEACVGPVRLDVLRLSVSWLLALDERGMLAENRVDSCRALLEGWTVGAFGARVSMREPEPVRRLVAKVAARTKQSMHRAYTRARGGRRTLLRDDRLWPVSRAVQTQVRAAFERYATHTCTRHDVEVDHMMVLDVARRVAGTGSLGAERFAVLAAGGVHGEWLFDLKQECATSASGLPAAGLTAAARVVHGIETSAPAPPRMLGTTKMGGLSMLVRRLSPQEDKLDPGEVETSELGGLAHYVGWLAGRMHRRGAVGSLGRGWTEADRRAMRERAITLAGIHESMHLAYVSFSQGR
jgi:uncharacterized protein (DUF2252 family)